MSYSLSLDNIKILIPNMDDPEIEQVHLWMQLAIRAGYGEGKDLEGGPTWSMRDFLRVIKEDAPRAFMELSRAAEERTLTGEELELLDGITR